MKLLQVIRDTFFGQVEPTFFQENQAELHRTNYRMLRKACIFSSAMCLFLFCLTLINPMIGELSHFYFVYTLIFGVLTVLVLTVVNRRREFVAPIFYVFAAAIFILVIDVGTRRTPELPAVTFYVFLIIVPILFVTRPIYAVALSVAACMAFCITTAMVKGAGSYLAQTDMLNAICCTIVGIGVDVTIINLQLENIGSKRYLQHQSTTDELTGLPNRRGFDRYIEDKFKERREHGGNLAILMIDIDDFKSYNDTYGHIKGDECLCMVSRSLERVTQVHDVFLARFGGEEFVAVADYRSKETLRKGANRLVESVAELDMENTGAPAGKITISVGYATLQDTNARDFRKLMDCADTALYAAKAEGKNRSRMWEQ